MSLLKKPFGAPGTANPSNGLSPMPKPAPNHAPAPVRKIFLQILELIEYFWTAKQNPTTTWAGDPQAPENLKAEANFLLAERDPLQLSKQIWAPYESALIFRLPTVWCCRKHDPSTWLFMLVCMIVKLHPQDFFDGFITEPALRRMQKTARKLRRPQLKMTDVSEPEDFWLFLEDLAQNEETSVVFCDWQLDTKEQQVVETITKHKSILFVWPEQ
jgi:hypothetical protein